MPDSSLYPITAYGAVADGRTDCAAAIQSAIDACTAAGGGRVVIPAGGTYRSGSFTLKSNVDFHVEAGARLLSGSDEADFPLRVFNTGEETDKRLWIAARNAENITISGRGEIDGNCFAFADEEGPYGFRKAKRWRPAMTCFEACRNFTIRDVTFRNAANWALHFTGCDGILVDGIRILNSLKFPNCDGIDPDHCRNVRIANCHIEAGDDCIVLKNTRPFAHYGPTENVVVTNCTLVSTSSAIKVGTESVDTFRNLIFSNCVISRSNRGLSLHLRDEGDIENVIFSDMIVETRRFDEMWWGAGEPIYITAVPRDPQTRVGAIRNVRFRNILCRGENGVFLYASELGRIENVTFDQVRVDIVKTSRWPADRCDLRPCPPEELPEGSQPIGRVTPWGCKGTHPVHGFSLYRGRSIRMRDCEVLWSRQSEPPGKSLYDFGSVDVVNAPAHPA